ncbi:unnamed protein product [Schistocephalus solidus]|uniref:Uncharacterized protein n=1 Tax=Schistocephalus solidus TaxID=70667 RepID=A0A183S8C6_SCHSO|nr:unnamed protein product [Schistocephalus solidus]
MEEEEEDEEEEAGRKRRERGSEGAWGSLPLAILSPLRSTNRSDDIEPRLLNPPRGVPEGIPDQIIFPSCLLCLKLALN